MSILSAIRNGLRRAGANPRLIAFLWLFNFLMALPLTIVLSEQIESSLGASLVSQKLQKGFDIDWYEEFNDAANGVGKTFSPAVIGIGPFIGNLESWLDGRVFAGHAGIVGLGAGYMIVWAFLLGGILDHFARGEERLTMERFFGAGGRYFVRFFMLTVLTGVFYFIVFAFVSPFLFALIANITRETTVERTVFLLTAGAYLVTALLLVLFNMTSDYAKIAMVLDAQENVVAAVRQGLHFIFSHPVKTFGLYLGLGVVLLLGLGIYSVIAPGANQSDGFTVALAFLLGQVFLVVKLLIRLTFLGGQMALYESTAEKRVAGVAVA